MWSGTGFCITNPFPNGLFTSAAVTSGIRFYKRATVVIVFFPFMLSRKFFTQMQPYWPIQHLCGRSDCFYFLSLGTEFHTNDVVEVDLTFSRVGDWSYTNTPIVVICYF